MKCVAMVGAEICGSVMSGLKDEVGDEGEECTGVEGVKGVRVNSGDVSGDDSARG